MKDIDAMSIKERVSLINKFNLMCDELGIDKDVIFREMMDEYVPVNEILGKKVLN